MKQPHEVFTLGELLKILRHRARMSQQQVADKAKVTRNTVSLFEAKGGERTHVDVVRRLFAAVGYRVLISVLDNAGDSVAVYSPEANGHRRARGVLAGQIDGTPEEAIRRARGE